MSNIYFTTLYDGNNEHGIGALVQSQVACYIASKIYKVNYYFTGFKNMYHYQYYSIDRDSWDLSINNFFNFPITEKLHLNTIYFNSNDNDLLNIINNNNNIIINIDSSYLLRFMDIHINQEYTKNICEELRFKINIPEDEIYFKKEETNIAFHIRVYTQTDCCKDPNREYFNDSKIESTVNKLKNIDSLIDMPNKIYHIYSQGNSSDFEFLKDTNLNIVLHIEEYPTISLYHMINADVLITANSSFSYISHILGNHKLLFVRDTFFHKWKNHSIKI
jgi:hypothetical protein